MVAELSLELSLLDASCGLPLDAPFTAAVARAEGVSRQRLSIWHGQGLLRQPIRGVYVVTQLADSTMLRAQCLALVAPADCVIVDRHAGWLHGADMVLAPNEHLAVMPIHMFRPSGHGRLRNGLVISGERNLRPEDTTEVAGVPVSTLVRTAWDLGRVRSRQQSIAGMDQMLRLPGFPHSTFLGGIERFRGQRWVTNLRTLGPLATGKSESQGESALRLGWYDAGLPHPEPQLEIWEDGLLIARVDVGNADLGYGSEYNGDEWHSSEEQRLHDQARLTRVGQHLYVVDEFTRADVYGQRRNLEQLLVAGAKRAEAERIRCSYFT
jgi:hypothetical protein